jgi:hypothetical protein
MLLFLVKQLSYFLGWGDRAKVVYFLSFILLHTAVPVALHTIQSNAQNAARFFFFFCPLYGTGREPARTLIVPNLALPLLVLITNRYM